MLSTIDVVIIVASMLFVISVGAIAGRKRGDTAHGYFLGGNKMPWWLIGTAFVATGISSEQMIGTVGITYDYGMAIGNWEWFALPCYTMVLVFFIPIYLKNKVTTVSGFMSDRFGPAVGTTYSCILLLLYICVYMVTVLYAGSLAFSTVVFGPDVAWWQTVLVLLLIAVCVGAYTIHGGLTSVMWADLFQCILLMAGGVTLFLVALHQIDPDPSTGTRWGALVAGAAKLGMPERMHIYQSPDHPMAPFLGVCLATFGAFTFYQVGNQAMAQRMLSARSTWDALVGLVLAQCINFFRPMVTCFIGLIVWHWINVMGQNPEMVDKLAANKDLAFTFMLGRDFVPTGIRGVVMAGLIAATMATLSGLVNSTSTLFSTDIYKNILHKGATDREMVRMGRTAAFVALLLAACISPIVGRWGVFKFFQNALNFVACPFMITMLMGMFWKRVNYPAAMFGLVGGIIIQIIVAVIFSGSIPGIPYLHFQYVGAIAQVIIGIGIAIIALCTAPPDYRKVKPRLWSIKLLKAYDSGEPRPWYQQLKVLWGTVAVIWFGIYFWFW